VRGRFYRTCARLTRILAYFYNAAPSSLTMMEHAEVVEWQTRTFEGRVAQAVRVQVPPSAPMYICSTRNSPGGFPAVESTLSDGAFLIELAAAPFLLLTIPDRNVSSLPIRFLRHVSS
jgi:hypothetical protein